MADNQSSSNINVGVFSDAEGNQSSMRWMAAFSLAIAGALALGATFTNKSVDTTLVLYFLLGSFGGKVGQKFAENFKATRT